MLYSLLWTDKLQFNNDKLSIDYDEILETTKMLHEQELFEDSIEILSEIGKLDMTNNKNNKLIDEIKSIINDWANRNYSNFDKELK